jgi:hypothetical protein
MHYPGVYLDELRKIKETLVRVFSREAEILIQDLSNSKQEWEDPCPYVGYV